MIVGGPQSVRDERKRRKQVTKEAKIMAVETLSQSPITFRSELDKKVSTPHSNPLVITTRINKFVVKRILINTGSSVNLIILDVLRKLALDKKKNLSKVLYSLVGSNWRQEIQKRDLCQIFSGRHSSVI